MRSRKEIIYLNISQLTDEEKIALADMGLNACDNCGEIDLSENLHWITGEDYKDDPICQNLVASGIVALCRSCYDMRDENIAQCGSCEHFFIAEKEKDQECPHCHSGNWTYGCIDDPSGYDD